MNVGLASKRALDLAVGAQAIGFTLPLWLLVALGVRLTSPGPVFHAGKRVGKDGRLFAMYKFRTMRAGADRQGPAVTGAADSRVTPSGRILRRAKLDELPQLLNVMRGEMSLVGPRPEAPRYVELYDARQRQVLTVRPGITGPTQLVYRYEEQMLHHEDVEQHYVAEIMPRKLEMDLEYVRTRSFVGDLRLLLATIAALIPEALKSTHGQEITPQNSELMAPGSRL